MSEAGYGEVKKLLIKWRVFRAGWLILLCLPYGLYAFTLKINRLFAGGTKSPSKDRSWTLSHLIWRAAHRIRKIYDYFSLRISRRIVRYLSFLLSPLYLIVYYYKRYTSIVAVYWMHHFYGHLKQDIYQYLVQPGRDTSSVSISLVGASRKLGNPNNKLAKFCQSLLETADDLDHIELVVRIDDDDDLLYYLDIKERYRTHFALRFIIGSRMAGYTGLHTLVSDNLNHLSEHSQIVFGFADDCLLKRKGWDTEFLKVLQSYPDNIVFINTLRELELPFDEKQQFFWHLWRSGPPSPFTAVGRKVLEITASVAKRYPGWTAYGNSVMCDSFFETLQFYIWQKTGQRRAPVVKNTMIMQQDVLIAHHKEGGLFSESPVAIKSYSAFLRNDTQVVIEVMADAIASEMQRAFSTEEEKLPVTVRR